MQETVKSLIDRKLQPEQQVSSCGPKTLYQP